MDSLHEILIPMGVHITSSVILDRIKNILKGNSLTEKEVVDELLTLFPQVNIDQATMISKTAIKILAEKGEIKINDSKVHSNSFDMTSLPGSKIKFSGSRSSTDSGSIIDSQGNSTIDLSNGGQIQQPSNGDIIIKASPTISS